MKVAFWSPNHGQTGTTTTALTMASMVAITNNYKVLLGHSQFERSTLERCLIPARHSKDQGFLFSDNGLDALRRLAKNNRLVPEMVSDYTTPLLASNRLDLLQGIAGFNSELVSEEVTLLRKIFASANKVYDLVMIDVHSGLNQELTKSILADAEVVVVCLNQNLWLLEDFFGGNEAATLKDKKVIYHIGQYTKNSKYSIKNIKKMFDLKHVIATPYCPELMDACNSGAALDFFMRHSNSNKKDKFHPMIQQVMEAVEVFLGEMTLLGEEALVT